MATCPEVLVFCCHEDDVAVLRQAAGASGSDLCVVDSAVEVAHQTVARRPVAVFVGAGKRSRANLDVVPMIRAVMSDLPVIVIAEEDSLELERSARQKGIFYYIVRPIEGAEAEALLKDVLRRGKH
jgi:DNA-binding NtrC family response regulator